MLTNANLSTAISEAGKTFSITDDTVSLVAMPLFHIGGSVGRSAPCRAGAAPSSCAMSTRACCWSSSPSNASRRRSWFRRPDDAVGLPVLSSTDLSSLRLIFYGASPISEDVLVKCMSTFGCDFCQVYGMTETTGAITALSFETTTRRAASWPLRSAGKPHDSVQLRIVDPETGKDADVDEVGEVWTVPLQHGRLLGKPDETARTIDSGGWLRTGDAGYFDAEGTSTSTTGSRT